MKDDVSSVAGCSGFNMRTSHLQILLKMQIPFWVVWGEALEPISNKFPGVGPHKHHIHCGNNSTNRWVPRGLSRTFLKEITCLLTFISLLVSPTAHISLDPQTSHPKLLVSENHQQVRFSYKWQNTPDSPQRFDRATCVLAQHGFTRGRHTWVVSVDLVHGGSCTVGVASEDVQRKGELRLRPEDGVWAMRLAWGFVSALASFPTRLALEEQPRKVRVSLDYEVGWVTFVNAVTQEHIYTFTASFTRKVFPFFGLWGRGSSFLLSS